MEVKDVLSKDRIIFNLDSDTKEKAIVELSNILMEQGFLLNKDEYIKAVLQRENHSTTGIGNNIAIPHGKSNSVTKSAIVFAKTKKDIEWESLDEKPVNLIFLLAISELDQTNGHLRLLSQIASKLMDDDIVLGLQKTQTADEVIKIFNEGDIEL
ncbi:PTS sugar transporter subunit IIA [Peribacillus loiseleuriae]|uniref:PTS mannose transporter subunit IIAB n=1 Tax=Peribacillus loiseleuriae TaxID=1679170 RepID=A0A0K9GSV2_9BACI|nr:PTS sugar transporter subunit IIA [Peribacillus loiseleuriae]KMY49715.1 PTS mannose transporter subunit IIAB [Peribacillus loiseleuriae]